MTTHHEERLWSLTKPLNFRQEVSLSLPAETENNRAFKCFTGVDIAAKDFTAATLLPANKPKILKI